MIRSLSLILAVASAFALTACANSQDNFPSLARRPAERLNTPAPDAMPAPAPTQATPDPAFLERIAGQMAKARSAHDRFVAHTGPARALVAAASGAPVASEAWSVATIALSELEAARSEAMIALAELDGLYARAEVDGTNSPALTRARTTVMAIVGEQDQVLADLQGRLES